MTDAHHAEAAPAALSALALATLLASLGVSVATITLPSLARDLAVGVADVQWVVVAYLLAGTVSIVTVGRLGDRVARRLVLLGGFAAFALGGALAAFAPGLAVLIAGRAVQGIGGAVLTALPIAIVRDTVPAARTGTAMGLLGTMSAVGTALGPSVGGLLIAELGWRAAFASLAVLAIVGLLVSARALPPADVSTRHPQGLGLLNSAALAVTLTGYAFIASGGVTGPALQGGLLVGVVLVGLVLFLAVEVRAEAPLLPLALLRQRLISLAVVMNALVTTVMMATLVVGPFFLTFSLGFGEAAAGLIMAVGPLTAALAGVPAGRLTDRFGAKRMLWLGLVDMFAALVAFALLPRVFGAAGYALALITLTPGFQLFLAANNTVVMMAAPERERGVLSGLLGLSRNLGFMTGASVMVTLFAAALGGVPVTEADGTAVASAYSVTFLAAAGLVAVAFVLTLLLPPSHR